MIWAGEGVRMWIRKLEVMPVGEQSSKSLCREVGVASLFDEPNLMIMYIILAYACKL